MDVARHAARVDGPRRRRSRRATVTLAAGRGAGRRAGTSTVPAGVDELALRARGGASAAARPTSVRGDAAGRARGAGARVPGDARAVGRPAARAGRAPGRRAAGPRRHRASRCAPTLGRRARRRARLDAPLSVHLPRAAGLARGRARRRARAGARSPPRCPAYLDGDGLLKYFPTHRAGQRGADRVRAGDRAGGGLDAAARTCSRAPMAGPAQFVERHASRAAPRCPTADLSLRKLAARRGARAPRRRRPGAARQHHHRAQPLADLGGARLVERPAPHARHRPTATRGSREAEQIVRARLNVQGTTHGLLHRARRRISGG